VCAAEEPENGTRSVRPLFQSIRASRWRGAKPTKTPSAPKRARYWLPYRHPTTRRAPAAKIRRRENVETESDAERATTSRSDTPSPAKT
jgi:hypothetical protein